MEKWNDPKTLAIWIAVVLFVIIFLIYSFLKIVKINFKKRIENQKRESQLLLQHQENLMQNSILAQDQERNRIASDLHDSLIGKLTLLRMKTSLQIQLSEIESLLDESISEARRISHDLSPPLINLMDLEEILENLMQNWKKFYNIRVVKNNSSDRGVSDDLKLQLVRIIQEQIVNSHKHAKATQLQLVIRKTSQNLQLMYTDNGQGFDINTIKNGIGIKNIELRLHKYQAKYKFKSSSKGTVFLVSINNNQTL